MTIDERIEALTMNLELMSHDIEGLNALAGAQNEKIGKVLEVVERLARIAELHHERLVRLEDGKNN